MQQNSSCEADGRSSGQDIPEGSLLRSEVQVIKPHSDPLNQVNNFTPYFTLRTF
jgi:hypothetical protein